MKRQPAGLLVDLDGTLYQDGRAIDGAPEAVERLRVAGLPIRFTTNTTRRPRSRLVEDLRRLGFSLRPDELLTAPMAAVSWLREHKVKQVALYLAEATFAEFTEFTIDQRQPEAVVVGDMGERWSFGLLNQAFRAVLGGARLLAIQKNRFWKTESGLQLDAGPFVAALEYATDTKATLVGKPSPAFFESAAGELSLALPYIAAVGDDIMTDVKGGQGAGCLGVLVRTGKYRPEDERREDVVPDAVIDSIAALPELVGC